MHPRAQASTALCQRYTPPNRPKRNKSDENVHALIVSYPGLEPRVCHNGQGAVEQLTERSCQAVFTCQMLLLQCFLVLRNPDTNRKQELSDVGALLLLIHGLWLLQSIVK